MPKVLDVFARFRMIREIDGDLALILTGAIEDHAVGGDGVAGLKHGIDRSETVNGDDVIASCHWVSDGKIERVATSIRNSHRLKHHRPPFRFICSN